MAPASAERCASSDTIFNAPLPSLVSTVSHSRQASFLAKPLVLHGLFVSVAVPVRVFKMCAREAGGRAGAAGGAECGLSYRGKRCRIRNRPAVEPGISSRTKRFCRC